MIEYVLSPAADSDWPLAESRLLQVIKELRAEAEAAFSAGIELGAAEN